jgi:hypothetical protein
MTPSNWKKALQSAEHALACRNFAHPDIREAHSDTLVELRNIRSDNATQWDTWTLTTLTTLESITASYSTKWITLQSIYKQLRYSNPSSNTSTADTVGSYTLRDKSIVIPEHALLRTIGHILPRHFSFNCKQIMHKLQLLSIKLKITTPPFQWKHAILQQVIVTAAPEICPQYCCTTWTVTSSGHAISTIINAVKQFF